MPLSTTYTWHVELPGPKPCSRLISNLSSIQGERWRGFASGTTISWELSNVKGDYTFLNSIFGWTGKSGPGVWGLTKKGIEDGNDTRDNREGPHGHDCLLFLSLQFENI